MTSDIRPGSSMYADGILLFFPRWISEKKKNPQTLEIQRLAGGAGNVTRTHDLLITNQLLYRLSYTSVLLTALCILP